MRSTIFSAVAMATASAVALGVSAPATAQVRQAIAVVDIDQAIGQSSAAQTAGQQMQTTYKANIDQLNSRRTALQTDIQQKQTALQSAAQAAGENPPAATQTNLQNQYNELQRAAQEAQAELQRLEQPLQLSRAYVLEQIGAKLAEAMRSVMTKHKIDLLVKAEAAEAFAPTSDVTNLLVQEINALVPSVSITPPQGWTPGGQQQQQQGAAAPAAGATAPAAPTPAPGEGR